MKNQMRPIPYTFRLNIYCFAINSKLHGNGDHEDLSSANFFDLSGFDFSADLAFTHKKNSSLCLLEIFVVSSVYLERSLSGLQMGERISYFFTILFSVY